MGSLAGKREPLILALWERGAGLARWTREEALLTGDAPPPSRLGARNVALLRLRAHLFGPAWPLRSACPDCGTDSEFVVDCAALADDLNACDPNTTSTQVSCGASAMTLRAATADDLRAIAALPDADTATRALLARCIADDEPLDSETLARLSAELESLDPGAVVSFALRCPNCRHDWSAVIDMGEAVWAELQRAAERALIEVDALARTYGWSERQVFGLSPVRRAAYLQLVGAS